MLASTNKLVIDLNCNSRGESRDLLYSYLSVKVLNELKKRIPVTFIALCYLQEAILITLSALRPKIAATQTSEAVS